MAFDFPNPPTADPVTNPATGITYQYDAASQTWVVVSSTAVDTLGVTLDDLQEDVESLQSLLPLETQARQQGDANLQTQINNLDIPTQVTYQIQTDKVLRSGEPAIELVDSEGFYSNVKFEATGGLAVSSSASSIIIDGSGIDAGGDVNLDNYYTKDEIDNQFTLRGVGYTYLVSSFSGTITIRPGEIHTNNRNVGQITQISLGPEDDNGKQRRDAVEGDSIEIYDLISTKYYRYEITSGSDGTYGVTFVGSDDDRNDPLSMGAPYLIYLYPTHINSGNYYDKAEADARFMSVKPGQMQDVQRSYNFQAACEYTGVVQYSNNIANKRYVDEQVATRATVEYVNDEVDKMITSFNTEDAEPDIFYGDYAPTGEMKNGNVWFDSMNLRMNVWSQGAWINPDREGDSVDLSPYQKIVQPPGRKFKKISATQPTTSGSFTYYESNGQVKIGLNRRDAEGVKWLDMDFNDTLAAPVLFRITQWQNNTSHHTVRYGAIEKIVATAGGQIVCDVRYHQTNGTISDNSNYFITIGGLI